MGECENILIKNMYYIKGGLRCASIFGPANDLVFTMQAVVEDAESVHKSDCGIWYCVRAKQIRRRVLDAVIFALTIPSATSSDSPWAFPVS